MFSTAIIVLSLIGLFIGVLDRLLTKKQKDALERLDSRAHTWLERLKLRQFADGMRNPRTLFTLFILFTLPAVFLISETSGVLRWILFGILSVCGAVVAANMWFLARAASNVGFVGRLLFSVVLVCSTIFVISMIGNRLGLNEENQDDFDYLMVAVIMSLLWYYFLIVLSSLGAFVLSGLLSSAEWFYRFCILNNKHATFLILVALGAVAGAYRLLHG